MQVETRPDQPSFKLEAAKSDHGKETAVWNNRAVVIIAASVGVVLCAVIAYEVALLVYEKCHHKIWTPNVELLKKDIVNSHISQSLIQKFEALQDKIDFLRLLKRLKISADEEKNILSLLENDFDISPDQWAEILKGAHVLLEDDGKTYGIWEEKLRTQKSRISSHASDKDAKQFEVKGPLVKAFLYSIITMNHVKFTWFQMENNPLSFGHIFRHGLDYFKYKLTGCNQGPYGSSTATDKLPILLKRRQI